MANIIGLYRRGDSLIHRTPAGVKLLLLIVVGMCSWWLMQHWQLALSALCGSALLYLVAHYGPIVWWQQVRSLRWILLISMAFYWWASGWTSAIALGATLSTMVALASLVTITTPMTQLLASCTRALGPLRHLGVDPDRIALIVLIGVRAVPLVSGLAREVREAQIARRSTRSISAFATPLIVRSLREADALGEALVARGFED